MSKTKNTCYSCRHNCHLIDNIKEVMCTHKQSSYAGEIISVKHSCNLYEPNANCFIAAVMDLENTSSGKSIYTKNQT